MKMGSPVSRVMANIEDEKRDLSSLFWSLRVGLAVRSSSRRLLDMRIPSGDFIVASSRLIVKVMVTTFDRSNKNSWAHEGMDGIDVADPWNSSSHRTESNRSNHSSTHIGECKLAFVFCVARSRWD